MTAGGVVHCRPESTVPVAQEHAHVRAAGEIGRHQVQVAVEVEVGHSYGLGVRAGAVFDRRLESAVTIAEEHADVGGIGIGGNQIQVAVMVEVPDRDEGGARAGGVAYFRLERAVALAEEHDYRLAPVELVGHGQVWYP